MASTIGVPIKLLHESLGHIITVELKSGALYRGKLADAEDSLNISLKDITVTGRDGKVSQLDQVYIRGSMVRFFIVPDMLQNAPMFKRVGPNAMRGRGIGTARGRATIMRGAYSLDRRSSSRTKMFRFMSSVSTCDAFSQRYLVADAVFPNSLAVSGDKMPGGEYDYYCRSLCIKTFLIMFIRFTAVAFKSATSLSMRL
ncbi:small nuclear ribonucleoprotein Sm D3 [Ceratobasidium sp. UAMH 11750]|nr:small nuclear ribonucleoprotein Sm D3 [Ceratobasidium sp. UAMH 11750]